MYSCLSLSMYRMSLSKSFDNYKQETILDLDKLKHFFLNLVVELSNSISHTIPYTRRKTNSPETFHWQEVSSEKVSNIV